MNDWVHPARIRGLALRVISAWLLSGAMFIGSVGCGPEGDDSGGAGTVEPDKVVETPEAVFAKRVESFCSSCHGYADPTTLPRSHWARKIKLMYELAAGESKADLSLAPAADEVIAYYERLAPESLPSIASTAGAGLGPIKLGRTPIQLSKEQPFPAVSQVDVKTFAGPLGRRPYVVLSDMRFGMVALAAFDFDNKQTRILPLVKARHPAHVDVVDLDLDGNFDLLVSDLGWPSPTDDLVGSLEFFRRKPEGGFEKITLLEKVGRVSEARAADFDGDGDLDIVCAIFGWRKEGEIIYLENVADKGKTPSFKRTLVDVRSGAINLPICDINGDGRLDFLALISQHHETIYAYLGQAKGGFVPHEIYRAPHANWGSCEIQLVDIDGDRDLDLLYSHGDTLDDIVVKPYHGVRWLENLGGVKFRDHAITNLYGAYGARAGDLDGDGDIDFAACAFLPRIRKDEPSRMQIESLIWLEQTSPGVFKRHSIEAGFPFHPCIEVADVDADGRNDILTGNMTMSTGPDWRFDHSFAVWRNITE